MADTMRLSGEPKARLCIVEDDSAVADALRVQLTRNGFSVAIFGTAAEFLASQNLDQYDCLLIDQRLPVMSGLELVELLRTRAYSRPVLLIWGQREPQLLPRITRAGISETLAKPLAPAELLAALRRTVPALRT
jgi:FixJ family two-component response regulator